MQKDKEWLILKNRLLRRTWFKFKCKMTIHSNQTLRYQTDKMNTMKKKKVMMINQKLIKVQKQFKEVR